jgi:protein-disulfide isomerase
MSRTAWIVFTVICLGLLGGLAWISQGDRIDVSDVNEFSILGATEKSGTIADHVYGKTDAKVVIYEYGDYQCPGCGSAYPVLKTVYEKYKDKVAFVFRNFPLTTIHPNARAAASAAEAAGLQGKYWQMHDLLYVNQNAWSNADSAARVSTFTQYARSLGLNTDTFSRDLSSNNIAKKIAFDTALGKKLSVKETPTIYVNTDKITQYYKDDKLVEAKADGAASVLSSADAFEKLIIIPALTKAGISTR